MAREVVFSGGFRRLETLALERQMRGSMLRARRQFEALARSIGVPHQFLSTRGDLVAELERAAAQSELLIVDMPPRQIGSRAWWGSTIHELAHSQLPAILFLRDGEPEDHRPVIMIVQSEEDLPRTSTQARRLARALGSRVLAAITSDNVTETQSIFARLVSGPSSIASLKLFHLARCDAESIAQFARRQHASAIVLPADHPATDADLVRELLRKTGCALLLVNSRDDNNRESG
ncbi:hypothetical protein F6455_18290 [Proteobacteria bacterium 005FR1]|nr:hypothetical protein [Proteobacteria bacterium 005FR1]